MPFSVYDPFQMELQRQQMLQQGSQSLVDNAQNGVNASLTFLRNKPQTDADIALKQAQAQRESAMTGIEQQRLGLEKNADTRAGAELELKKAGDVRAAAADARAQAKADLEIANTKHKNALDSAERAATTFWAKHPPQTSTDPAIQKAMEDADNALGNGRDKMREQFLNEAMADPDLKDLSDVDLGAMFDAKHDEIVSRAQKQGVDAGKLAIDEKKAVDERESKRAELGAKYAEIAAANNRAAAQLAFEQGKVPPEVAAEAVAHDHAAAVAAHAMKTLSDNGDKIDLTKVNLAQAAIESGIPKAALTGKVLKGAVLTPEEDSLLADKIELRQSLNTNKRMLNKFGVGTADEMMGSWNDVDGAKRSIGRISTAAAQAVADQSRMYPGLARMKPPTAPSSTSTAGDGTTPPAAHPADSLF